MVLSVSQLQLSAPVSRGGRTRVLGTGLYFGAHVCAGYLALWCLYPTYMGVNAPTLSYCACIAGLCADNPYFWASWPHRVKREKKYKHFFFGCFWCSYDASPYSCWWNHGVTPLTVWKDQKSGAFWALCVSMWMAYMKSWHNASLTRWRKEFHYEAAPIRSCSLMFYCSSREDKFLLGGDLSQHLCAVPSTIHDINQSQVFQSCKCRLEIEQQNVQNTVINRSWLSLVETSIF